MKTEYVLYDSTYLHFRKCKLIWSDRNETNGYQETGWGELQRGTRIPLEVRNMSIILISVMVSQVYTYVKTHQIVHFKYV